MNSKLSFLTPVLCLTLLAPSIAFGQYTFTKVVDTTAPFPSGTGNFSSFNDPVIHNGVVAFEGSATTNTGVFRWNAGTLLKAADFSTPIPASTGNFSFFSGGVAMSVESGVVTFRANGNSTGGLYQYDGVSLSRLLDTTFPTVVPGGSAPFNLVVGLNGKDGLIAFVAQTTNSGSAIYVANGGILNLKLAPATAYPGGTGNLSYSFSSPVSTSGGNFAFWAADSANFSAHAIFSLAGNTLRKVAEKNVTLVPDMTNTFSNLQNPPDVSGTNVAFFGSYSGGSGIFAAHLDGSGLAALVTTTTPIPNGSGNFTAFQGFEYDNGDLVFRGAGSSSQQGIYLLRGGVLSRIVDRNTALDGIGPAGIGFRDAGYVNGELAFGVTFTNTTRAIYTTTVGTGGGATGGALGNMTFSAVSGFSFLFTGTSDQSYRIQFSTNIATTNWTDLTNFNYTAPITINDPGANGSVSRFYRAVSP